MVWQTKFHNSDKAVTDLWALKLNCHIVAPLPRVQGYKPRYVDTFEACKCDKWVVTCFVHVYASRVMHNVIMCTHNARHSCIIAAYTRTNHATTITCNTAWVVFSWKVLMFNLDTTLFEVGGVSPPMLYLTRNSAFIWLSALKWRTVQLSR